LIAWISVVRIDKIANANRDAVQAIKAAFSAV
jgi:hypothetical protein